MDIKDVVDRVECGKFEVRTELNTDFNPTNPCNLPSPPFTSFVVDDELKVKSFPAVIDPMIDVGVPEEGNVDSEGVGNETGIVFCGS